MRALGHRRREDALEVEALRAQIDIGLSDLERGNATDLDDVELDDYLTRLASVRAQPTRRKRGSRWPTSH